MQKPRKRKQPTGGRLSRKLKRTIGLKPLNGRKLLTLTVIKLII